MFECRGGAVNTTRQHGGSIQVCRCFLHSMRPTRARVGVFSEQGIDGIVEQDVRKTFYVGGVHVVCATASRDACCHACLRPDASFTHLVKVHSELEWRQCLQPPVCEILLRYPSFRFLSWLSAEHLASAYILGCAARLPSSQ